MRAVSFLKIATFLLVLIAFVYPVSAVWYNHSWINRMELVLDDSQISGTHSNFSMYVGVTSLDLNVSQSDGDDIIFVLDDGTKLSHEIDNFNSSTGVLHAYVKVPELNLSTKLYLYYNNPAINNSENASDVWLDYAAVWHLSQSPSAPGTYNVLDSTSNNNNCTADSVAMNSTNLVDGKFYKALNFSAVNNQSISALDSVSLSPTGTALTMVVWVKTPATLQNAYNVITTKSFNEGQASPYSAYSLYMANNALSNRFHAGAANATSWAQNIHSFAIATPAPPTTSTWYQVAFVKNATNHIGYVDGTIRTTINNTFNLVDTAWEFRIGGNPIGQEPFSGIVDEVTIRASTITPERMQTEYNNQNYPDTFITLGSEQTNTSNIAPTIISARLTPTIAYYNDTISGYCNATDENGDTLSYDYKWCGNGCATLNYTANISNFTIQEQFNSSDCINTSFENYCDGNYSTGVLSNDSGSVSAEYIKSGQLRGAIWEITYGLNVNNPQKINYTVDPTCISNNDTISLSTAIAYFSPYYNVFSCYNGTEYIELGSYTLTNGYLYEERLFLDYGLGFSSSNENLISTRTTDIDGSQFQYTDDIYLVCRANDGYLVSDWATSSILNISNTNITANSMISPSTAYKNDTLVGYCNATNDDSSLYYVNWTWYLNGVVNSTGQDFCDYMYCEYSQTAIVDTNISIMTKGQNWTLECFVDNYVGETDYSNSSIVISNSIPTVPSLSVNASLFVGEALVASASGSSDVDNDSLSYFYEFYNINDTSTVQAYSTTASYTVAVSDAHNIIRVRSKAYDGSVYSGVNESNTTINNSVPSFNESNFVSTISHGVNVSLQINASDTDADTLTYAINDTRFTINSSSGLINKTNSLSTVGEYNVTINVTDGTATISMSVFFNITNTAPNTSAAYISILPSPATIYDNLTCNVTSYSDIDNDTLTFYYNWTLDGIILGVHTGLLDSNNLTANNTNVTCSAIIDDGIINSTWITSPLVVFDDLTMPAMTYYLQSSSGYTDTSYYVYINCSDDYSGIASGYPKTSFIDPDNILAGNFSLSLINNTLYGLLYTFTKAGVYNNFSFYCADAQNNINSSVNTNLTFTSTTRPSNGTTPPTSGGGASEETTLKYGVISILQLLQRAKIIYKNNSYITNIKGLDDKHKEVTMNIGKKEYIFVENIITPLDLNSDGVPDATIKITDILPSVAKFILNYYNATTGRCDDNIFIDGFGEHTECEFACTLDGCQVLDVGQRASSARECSSRLLESGRCIATSPIKYILSEDYFGLQGVLSNTLNQITTIRDVKGIPVGKDITVTNVDNQEIFIKFFGEDLQDIAEEKLSAGVSHLFQLKIYPVRGKTKGFIDMVVAKNNFTVTHSILYEMSIVTCKDAGTKVSYAQECCSKVVDDNGVCMNSKSTKNNIYIYIGIVLLVAALTVIIFYLIRTAKKKQ